MKGECGRLASVATRWKGPGSERRCREDVQGGSGKLNATYFGAQERSGSDEVI